MEPGLLVFVTCVSGLAFGLLYFRVRAALFPQTTEDEAPPAPVDMSSDVIDVTPIPPRSSAFTESHTHGSSASEPPGTERTSDDEPEPRVQITNLDGPDLAKIATALERRGYLCLTLEEQATARDLIYRLEKRARFEPTRSKSAVILEATGAKRGGSKEYQRTSAIYDAIIGQPPPIIQKDDKPQQEAVNA
jgi:hypothetical protein